MRIAELYKSLQGEGSRTGTESIFVRLSGCNLRCWFCDTPYASWNPEGEDRSVDDVLEEVAALACRHVVITGGEPMLFEELIPLSQQLRDCGHFVTVETAGTRYLPVVCDLMSVSPKMSNSVPGTEAGRWRLRHEQTRHTPDVVRRLLSEYDYQLKFVIDRREDCDEMERYVEKLGGVDRMRVYLMPQGTDAAQLEATATWLAPYCQERGYRFCPRKQIEWYGLVRGT